MSFAIKIGLTIFLSTVTALAFRHTLLSMSPGRRLLVQAGIALVWAIAVFFVVDLIIPRETL
jgi:hypothetical protein